jgi:hypothetical protein
MKFQILAISYFMYGKQKLQWTNSTNLCAANADLWQKHVF